MRKTSTLLIALLLLGGCGDDSSPQDSGGDLLPNVDILNPSCIPGGCSGCCMGTVCQDGVTNAACGYGGNPCSRCSDGQVCKAGLCQASSCDPTSCTDGCCDEADNCLEGLSPQACGAGGKPCQRCESGQICSAGVCRASAADSYKVTLVSATITKEDCDVYGFGDCDAFVIIKVGEQEGESDPLDNTKQPVWNQELLTAPRAELLSSFEVWVYEWDAGSNDDLGYCSLRITDAELATGQIVQNCGTYVKDLTFSFSPL